MKKTPLTFERVKTVLLFVAVLFPESAFDEAEDNKDRVALITAQYLEDALSVRMSGEEFGAAVRACRRKYPRFPRISQIIDECRELRRAESLRRGLVALPQRTEADMDAQFEINRRGLAAVKDVINRSGKRMPGGRPRPDAA